MLVHPLQRDLVSTIGESVAIGAAGVIFWGDTSYASSVRAFRHPLMLYRLLLCVSES